MILPPVARKAALALHLAVSVGWIGAVVAYVPLDLAASRGSDAQTVRAAYVGMGLIASNVLLPLAFATLATGVVMSAGTTWGLFRHYWVVISLVMTTLALVVLLSEVRTIDHFARVAADPSTPTETLRGLGGTLVHSVGGLAVLLVVLVLNVFKPRGLTRYGWRKQREERDRAARSAESE